ncbi:MAG: MBL fold metallo-hydrolase, partial [Lachnospiraceae bacterium]|nr:MBL fold metallo-hydrolase [Lachnospiraceae bacterium]
MNIRSMVLGPVETNVYFLINEETDEAVLFDPAYAPETINSFAEKNGFKITAIFLTHGHFDHIAGVEGVRKASGAPVYASKREERLLSDGELNESLQSYGRSITVKADHLLKDG